MDWTLSCLRWRALTKQVSGQPANVRCMHRVQQTLKSRHSMSVKLLNLRACLRGIVDIFFAWGKIGPRGKEFLSNATNVEDYHKL